METITIKHSLSKSCQGTYSSIGFQVPDNLEKITVSYHYKGFRSAASGDVVDFGLEDSAGRFLGWSGSSRNSVSVGELESAKGYLTRRIEPGQWKIIIGAYKVASDVVNITYTIKFHKKQLRWYYGDLHMHSDASDGKFAIKKLAQMSVKLSLDFIAVTNHNNYSENYLLPHIPGLTLIPAVEWTHYKGHMNFYGVKNPFKENVFANSESEMLSIVGIAKELGALVSVNHPKCRNCPYLWNSDSVFDAMEVWNGPMRSVNADAIKWWTRMLRSGRKVPIVGGSDYHGPSEASCIGNPITALYAKSRSVNDLLYAIQNGHGFIAESMNGVQLELNCNGLSFGDTIAIEGGLNMSFTVRNMPLNSGLYLISEAGILYKRRNIKENSFSGTVLKHTTGFVYILVTRKAADHNIICAVSNPIYFE